MRAEYIPNVFAGQGIDKMLTGIEGESEGGKSALDLELGNGIQPFSTLDRVHKDLF